MRTGGLVFFFDYVDPISYLLAGELADALPDLDVGPLRWSALELRPPPEPLLHPADPWWAERWASAIALPAQRGLCRVKTAVVPWTRKAHELALHAESEGLGEEVHLALFDAFFQRGLDIGRIDVLLEIAGGLGLAPRETRVVLDVDRYAADVSALGAFARRLGIGSPPALALGTRVLEGFHNGNALRTFLRSP
jgi:predicted DsbA family dithiol-disulfide isomerase